MYASPLVVALITLAAVLSCGAVTARAGAPPLPPMYTSHAGEIAPEGVTWRATFYTDKWVAQPHDVIAFAAPLPEGSTLVDADPDATFDLDARGRAVGLRLHAQPVDRVHATILIRDGWNPPLAATGGVQRVDVWGARVDEQKLGSSGPIVRSLRGLRHERLSPAQLDLSRRLPASSALSSPPDVRAHLIADERYLAMGGLGALLVSDETWRDTRRRWLWLVAALATAALAVTWRLLARRAEREEAEHFLAHHDHDKWTIP